MINSREIDMAGLACEIGAKFLIYSDVNAAIKFSNDVGPDILVVAGWHHLIPLRFRELFRFPCLGFHASLLPRYRGGAPLNWALLNGDSEAGMSLFEIANGVDEGDIYGQVQFSIEPDDYISDLLKKSEEAALNLISEVLPRIASGVCRPRGQEGQVSYGLQRLPEDGLINWNDTAVDISRLVRAVSRPYPGAFSFLEGRRINIWRADAASESHLIYGIPGQIANVKVWSHPFVVSSSGVLRIVEATHEDNSDALPLLRQSHNKRFKAS
jgi:methionyl-tRNA formyltransferase